ncbi:MAG: hypothetical protein V2A76_01345 [Planctomycetota bacterium]
MTSYQVTVSSVSDKTVALLRSLSLVAGLGLRDGKHLLDNLVESLPCVLVAGIDQAVADPGRRIRSRASQDQSAWSGPAESGSSTSTKNARDGCDSIGCREKLTDK